MSTSRSLSGRMLGLDVGGKRTGVAVSDELGIVATPVCFVERGPSDRKAFADLVQRYAPVQLVAGLPSGLSGREGEQAADVRGYADALAAELGLPLIYWDERLTSAIAERALIESGAKPAKRREQIDAVAAAVMLQGYLDYAARRGR